MGAKLFSVDQPFFSKSPKFYVGDPWRDTEVKLFNMLLLLWSLFVVTIAVRCFVDDVGCFVDIMRLIAMTFPVWTWVRVAKKFENRAGRIDASL